MYGLNKTSKYDAWGLGANELHSHSSQSISPFEWFHWTAPRGFVLLKNIVGSALKPRTSSAMKQQALCKNWQGPNQSQTQRLSE